MELFSNFFQIAVTLLGFCMSGIRYLKDRKQTYFLLTCFYGCFALGSLYWTLYLRISKTPDGMIRNNNHHATPEQIGENIPKGTVKHTKRNTDQRSNQGFSCRKSSFLIRRKGVLQKIKENHTGYPAEL